MSVPVLFFVNQTQSVMITFDIWRTYTKVKNEHWYIYIPKEGIAWQRFLRIMSSTQIKTKWPKNPAGSILSYISLCLKKQRSGAEGQSMLSIYLFFVNAPMLLLLSTINVKYWHNFNRRPVDNDRITWRLPSQNQYHKQGQWCILICLVYIY